MGWDGKDVGSSTTRDQRPIPIIAYHILLIEFCCVPIQRKGSLVMITMEFFNDTQDDSFKSELIWFKENAEVFFAPLILLPESHVLYPLS